MPDEGDYGDGNWGRIVLVQVKNSYWLLEGEEHIDALLSGLRPYPKPVRCLAFDSEFELNLYLGDGQSLMNLWGINPLIVERLRKNNEMIDQQPGKSLDADLANNMGEGDDPAPDSDPATGASEE